MLCKFMSMAPTSTNLLRILTAFMSVSNIPSSLPATVVEDLNNLNPPPDFNSTITKNCQTNPSLQYCSNVSAPLDADLLREIFKSTVVASHLCNISGNPHCVDSFPKINLRRQPKFAPLYLSFDFFWKYCPLTVSSIDLSENSLTGNFPTQILCCSQIQALDLSNNNLSGEVPVQSFSSLGNLTSLNLSYNHFSEVRNISDLFNRFNSSSFIHSGLITSDVGFKFGFGSMLLLVSLPVFVVTATVILSKCVRNEHEFKLSVLKAATKGFSSRNLVGKNAYKGILNDGSEVRIVVHRPSEEVRMMFVEKSKILIRLRHKNIVPVLGWCNGRRFRATVTRWINTNDSIETWLLNSVPSWEKRMKVILGIASGICYLHEEYPQVDYDLKTRNVLLSDEGEPLITKLKVVEHHSSSTKAYKLGMFMLEIVTSRRPEEFGKSNTSFVEWVKMQYPENMDTLIDARMKKTVEVVSEAAEVIEFGLMCTDLLSDRKCPSWDKICDHLSRISSAAKVSARGGRKHHRGV